MLRALAPSLVVVVAIMAGAAIAFNLGAPAWVIHLGCILSALVIFPAYLRWDLEHFPDD